MPAVSYTPRPDGKREFQSKPTASDRPELNQMLILNELDSVRGVAEAATLFQNVDLSTLVTNYGYIGQRRVDSVVTETRWVPGPPCASISSVSMPWPVRTRKLSALAWPWPWRTAPAASWC